MSGSDTPTATTVTRSAGSVSAVRHELTDHNEVVPVEHIDYFLAKARDTVASDIETSGRDPGSIRDGLIDSAVAMEAAYQIVVSDHDNYLTEKSAADVTKRWDAPEFVARLKERRDDALELVITGPDTQERTGFRVL